MKVKTLVCCFLLINTIILFTGVAEKAAITDEVIRLHIISNNQSLTDQLIKYEVRDVVQNWLLKQNINEFSLYEAYNYLASNMGNIKDIAKHKLAKMKSNYDVNVTLAKSNLPAKMYKEKGYLLPSGKYLTLKIVLGEGKGQNWWCVAYPSQCLTRETVKINGEDLNSLKLKLKIVEWFEAGGENFLEFYLEPLMF